MLKKFQFFRVERTNSHLLDILNNNYFLELGVINPEVINRLLIGEKVSFEDICYKEIAVEGTGKITNLSKNSIDDELYFQLNYLKNIKRKSSSDKLFITCASIRYINDNHFETFAPICLIPISFNFQDNTIEVSGNAIPNMVFINYMFNKGRLEGYSLDSISKMHYLNFNSSEEIDDFTKLISRKLGCSYVLGNYITKASIEYVDFINQYPFSPIDSIYSVKPNDVINEYVKDCNSILSTNYTQKYIINNYKNNNSFVVNGKLGSGKTSTIINIVADSILNKKRVLYVNQDIDNICALQNRLYGLNLNRFVYSFVSENIYTNNNQEHIEDYIDIDNKFSKDDYKNYSVYLPSFTSNIRGFSGSKVYTDLAYLKRTYKNLKEIAVNDTLEAFEVDRIKNVLKDTLESLSRIGVLNKNIYQSLLVEHNDDVEQDVKYAVDILYKLNSRLKDNLYSFCDKYHFDKVKNYRSIELLYENINSFKDYSPLINWKDNYYRTEANNSLKEIEEIEFQLNRLYKVNRDYVHESSYNIGNMEGYLNTFCGSYFKSNDIDKLNKIIFDITRIKTLNSSIKSTLTMYNVIESKILNIFGLYKYDEELTSFIEKANSFYNSYKLSKKWFYESYNNNNSFISKYNTVKEIVEQNEVMVKRFSRFLVNKDYLELENNDKNNVVFDYYKIRKAKEDNFELDKLYHLYLNNLNKLKDLIYDKDFNQPLSFQIKSFIGYAEFTYSLNKEDYKWLKILVEYLNKNTEEYNTQVFNELNYFIVLVNKLKELFNNVLEYIPLNYDNTINNMIINLNNVVNYFNEVTDTYNQLYYVFINREYINVEYFEKVIDNDNKIKDLKNLFVINKDKYTSLLGESFKGEHTDINLCFKLINNFKLLSSHIDESYIEEFIKSIPSCIKEINTINSIYEAFKKAIQSLSTLFRGGLGKIILMSIEEASNYIDEFINNFVKLSDVINVLNHINVLKNFKLHSLVIDIYNGNVENLDVNFYYSVLVNLEKEFNELDNGFDNSNFLSNIDRLKKYEEAINNNNLRKLHLLDSSIQKYNKNSKNIPVGIYLMGVDKFNYMDISGFDLVIIDDAHLSTSNKYSSINRCKRVLIFGDKTYYPSIQNNLMNLLPQSSFINLSLRYILLDDMFKNEFSTNNKYILTTKIKNNYVLTNNQRDFIDLVLERLDNTNQSIKIIYKNNITKFKLYKRFVNILLDKYNISDTKELLSKIEFVNSDTDAISYSDYIFIDGYDYKDSDEYELNLLLYKFSCVSKELYFVSFKENEIVKNKFNLIPEYSYKNKLVETIIKDLKDNGLKVKYSYGLTSILIDGKIPLGVMLIGDNIEYISLINEVNYYYYEYINQGYNILLLDVKEFVANYDNAIKKILERIK